MGWEEEYSHSYPCPCGGGKLTVTTYGDDWNRTKQEISIECPECKEQYRIASRSWYKDRGNHGTTYYLLDSNYPEYDGIKLETYFPIVVDIREMPFDEYLIRSYTLAEIQEALAEFNHITAVSLLSGVAARIAKEHKRYFRTAKIFVLREYIEQAALRYNAIEDNKDNRIPIEREEAEARNAYEAELRKHLIRIPC